MSKNRFRKRQIKFWAVDEEYEILKRKSTESNLTMSAYLRTLLLFGTVKGSIVNFSKEDSKNIIYELNRIGNSVNQIAYRVNSNSLVREDDVIELREQVQELVGVVNDVVSNRR